MVNSKICTIIFKYIKKCLLCLHEKLGIVNFEDQDHLLNKRSELISKSRHGNKYYVITKQTINFTLLRNCCYMIISNY